jgi:hypothetical protein
MVRTRSVAAAMAVLPLPARDDAPRVIQQFTSIFLVSRVGELWRVYDSDTPDASDRQMPSRGSTTPYRVFIALTRTAQLRVHGFVPGESRETDPVTLQGQLDASDLRLDVERLTS